MFTSTSLATMQSLLAAPISAPAPVSVPHRQFSKRDEYFATFESFGSNFERYL